MFIKGITKEDVSRMLSQFRGSFKDVSLKENDSNYELQTGSGEKLHISKLAKDISVNNKNLKSANVADAIDEIIKFKVKPPIFKNGFEIEDSNISLGGILSENVEFVSDDKIMIFDVDVDFNRLVDIENLEASTLLVDSASIKDLSLSVEDGFLYNYNGKVVSKKQTNIPAGNGLTFQHGAYHLGGKLTSPLVLAGDNISLKGPSVSIVGNTSINGDLRVDSPHSVIIDSPVVKITTDSVINAGSFNDKVLGIKDVYGEIVLKDAYSPIAKDENGHFATAGSATLTFDKEVNFKQGVNADTFYCKDLSANKLILNLPNGWWSPEESKINSFDSLVTESINAGAKIISSDNNIVASSLVIAPEYIGINTESIRLPKLKDGALVIKNGVISSEVEEAYSLPVAFNTVNYGGTVPSYLVFEDTDITDIHNFVLNEGTYKLFGTFGFTEEVTLSIVDSNNKVYFKQEGKSIHLNNFITHLPSGSYRIAVVSNQPSAYLKNQTNFITIEA